MTQQADREAQELAAKMWSVAASDLSAQGFNSSLPWIKRHALIYVSDWDKRSVFVAVGAKGATEYVADDWMARVNEFFREEDTDPSSHLSAGELALTLRALRKGPLGALGTTAFFAEERDRLVKWSSDPAVRDRFVDFCRDPEIRRDGDAWRLSFFFFNRQGGVERWEARGTARRIEALEESVALADGTYRFAYV